MTASPDAAPRLGRDVGAPTRISRLGLVSVSRAGRDGIAYVSRLAERALTDLAGERPWLLDLSPAHEGAIALGERARFLGRLAAAQLRGGVDALLFTHVGLARAQRWVPRGPRRPYAVFVHGLEVTAEHMTPARMATLQGARLRIANSDFTARRLASEFPEAGSVEACPLALLPEETRGTEVDDALVSRIDTSDAVLIVGRMSAGERYTGHDQLIDAWPRVIAARPRAQLVIAGGGDDAARLQAWAAQAGLGDRVLFCGRVSDGTLAAMFGRVRAFAMPSRGEGFGLVYLEAMRAGLPCIASPDDGGADLVVDGETGFLVPQSDRSGLAAVVLRLLQDPGRARELGKAGRRRFEQRFTYANFRERLGTLLAREFAGPRFERASCAE